MAIGIDVMVALALAYVLITCGILLTKLRALNSLPYDRYQGAIIFYRLQVFSTMPATCLWYCIHCCSCCLEVCTVADCCTNYLRLPQVWMQYALLSTS